MISAHTVIKCGNVSGQTIFFSPWLSHDVNIDISSFYTIKGVNALHGDVYNLTRVMLGKLIF